MAKKNAGENSKKAAGNARKAEQAAKKKQEVMDKLEQEEAAEWSQGSKRGIKRRKMNSSKRKKQHVKAERDALLAAEEASMPSKPTKAKNRGAEKVAQRRTGKIDDFLDYNKDIPELSASGLDSALEALSLTGTGGGVSNKDIDRHPERRVKAAYNAYEEKKDYQKLEKKILV